MKKLQLIAGAAAVIASSLMATQAFALASFGTELNAKYPGKGLYTGSCTVCHNSTNDDPTWFSLYGSMLKQAGADDDLAITSFLTAVENFDYDNDGFTTSQEINGASFAGGSFGGTPRLITLDKDTGQVSAKGTASGTVSALSSVFTNPTGIVIPLSHKVLGGTVTFEMSGVTTGVNSEADFMFTTGGAQTGATASFVDKNNAILTGTPADGSGAAIATNAGFHVIIKDDGAYDLYTTAIFQQAAITAYTAFTPAVNTYASISPYLTVSPYVTISPYITASTYSQISPYATISPYAKVSSLATIEQYATVKAYAVVDDYAVIGAYAVINAYAYVAANVDIYTGIDKYTQVTIDAYAQVNTSITAPITIALPNGLGHIKARFAVVTTTPPIRTAPAYGSDGGGGSESGGLHCMTAGLGVQGAMFLGLLGLGLLMRRKPSA